MRMPPIYRSCALLFLAALHSCAAAGQDGAERAAAAGASLIGQAAPGAILHTIDGGRIDLAALYGNKPVYLKFWASWCGPCLRQMPGFARIHERYRTRIAVVAVNAGFSDSEARVRAYRTRHGLRMPVVIDDGSLARKLKLRVTPQHVVIGRDGRILHVGHEDGPELDAALEKALAQPAQAPVAAQELVPPMAPAPRFRPGDMVKGITLSTLDGAPVPLGTAGGPQVLLFFSPWCESYLRTSRPATARACREMREEAQRLAGAAGRRWLAIAAPLWADKGDLEDYVRTKRVTMPVALDADGAAFAAFGVRDIPTLVLLDAQGRVARVLGPRAGGIAAALREVAP